MSEIDLIAAESKATYEEIKKYIFERYNVKVSSLYIAQIKQKYGIIERDCYNKPKDKESKPQQCPLEKETLIEETLSYFMMIQ